MTYRTVKIIFGILMGISGVSAAASIYILFAVLFTDIDSPTLSSAFFSMIYGLVGFGTVCIARCMCKAMMDD
jgi:hypothetical protein